MMDTLRLMLLSLLIGATVSTSATYTDTGFQINQQIVFEQKQPPRAEPTPRIIYVTPQPAPKQAATQRPAGAGSSGTIYTGTSITRELYRGCTGDDVRMLQRLLKDLRYNVTVDGNFGTQTRNAVIQFQKNNGLKADGIAGTRTIRKLVSNNAVPADYYAKPRTTLSYGMVGQDVMDLQARLQYLGYYHDVLSGNFLTNTRSAVRWFQYNNNLPVDGIAGPLTLSRVYSANAIPAGGGPGPGPVWPTHTPPPGNIFTRNLYVGLSGADVTYLQQLLRDLGYFYGTPTGYYGTSTQSAVRMFQLYNGLNADGIAGNATFNRLLSGNAVPYPGTGATPRPTTTPTQKPFEPGEKCTYCGQVILKGEEPKHNTRAWCGVHMSCVSGDHTQKLACGHYVCEGNDGKKHGITNCNVPGHFECLVGVHSALPCGDYSCTPGDHSRLPCGHQHFMCNTAPNYLTMHQSKYGCNVHFLCEGGNHKACAWCGARYCDSSRPYDCANGNNPGACDFSVD